MSNRSLRRVRAIRAGEPSPRTHLPCPDGEKAGSEIWDYGPHPKGSVADPVIWVRRNTKGLDPASTLSFIAEDGGGVALVTGANGGVLAVVDFNVDDAGSYFPMEAKACPSSGIEGFS